MSALFCFVSTSSCGGGQPAAPSTPAAATVSIIAVTAASLFIGSGQQLQFAATATMSDGTSQNVSSSATWQSSNTAVLTISATGLATSVTVGDAKITATYSGKSATYDVSVRVQWSINGRAVSTADGAPITGGLGLLAQGADHYSYSSDGSYSISGPGAPTSTSITINATGFLTRTTTAAVNGARTGVDLDLISLASPFSLTFYREFLRGSADNNGTFAASFRWDRNPSFYINTRNGSSEMPTSVIADLAASLPALVTQVTDGRFTVSRIETGTETRPIVAGWMNVEYTTAISSCGAAAVGGNLVRINPICSDLTFVGLHETTHALGFWHHRDAGGLMSLTAPTGGSRGLNATEAFHTKIAFSRPRGNTDPDNDPASAHLLGTPRLGDAPMLACWPIK